MGPDVVPVFIASMIVMTLAAPLHWLRLHAAKIAIAQIFTIGVLFFMLIVEADKRFGPIDDNSWLPAEASGGF